MKLRELGEDRLLSKLLRHVAAGGRIKSARGDDCAVIDTGARELLVLKTDAVVEGIHYDAKASPAQAGWKAMARPLSDFAATSATPEYALVTLILPATSEERFVLQLQHGMNRAAAAFKVQIVGGETGRIDGSVAIVVMLAGRVERKRFTTRSGGRAGDELFVTGRLGGSLGGRHLRFLPRIPESRWLTEHFDVHAMMDLSDGLGSDLPRLAEVSGTGFEIDEQALPRHRGCTILNALSDGEDYELLFAIDPRKSTALQKAWRRKFPKLPLTRIGRLTPKSKFTNRSLPRGYVHFA